MTTYTFRRDDGSEVQVDFATMMQQDAAGFLTLPDGTVARRVNRYQPPPRREGSASLVEKPIVSDALGFTEAQLADFEADRVRHGFSGVEFRRDPSVPQFFQAHISSKAEWQRYIEHRGLCDRNGSLGSGAALTPEQFERAAQMVDRTLTERMNHGN